MLQLMPIYEHEESDDNLSKAGTQHLQINLHDRIKSKICVFLVILWQLRKQYIALFAKANSLKYMRMYVCMYITNYLRPTAKVHMIWINMMGL